MRLLGAASITAALCCRDDEFVEEHWKENRTVTNPNENIQDVEVAVLIELKTWWMVDCQFQPPAFRSEEKWLGHAAHDLSTTFPGVYSSKRNLTTLNILPLPASLSQQCTFELLSY